ncbi:MAG: orotate phosphoribosyltransferase [Myxococcota bacterium]
MDDRARLVALLRERSVRTGQFVLASGKSSDLYVDARVTTLHAEGAAIVARLVLARLRPDVVAVGGMTLGADPIACAASAASIAALGRPVHAFLIRKEPKGHGTSQQVEGLANLGPGAKVCVVEDTTTTGGSLLKAVEVARAAGLDVVQTLTVVDREEGAAEAIAAAGVPFEALTTRRDLVP